MLHKDRYLHILPLDPKMQHLSSDYLAEACARGNDNRLIFSYYGWDSYKAIIHEGPSTTIVLLFLDIPLKT